MRLIAGLATLLWIVCLATGASAHASLVSAEPADGSVLAVAPKTVQLRFNEPVTPAVISLIDAAGKTRKVAVSAIDQTVTLMLPDDLPRGTQVVSYRIISADGHPVGGSLLFSIGAATAAAAVPASDCAVAVLIWLTRIGVYLGLFVGVGGVFFAGWIGQGDGGTRVTIAALWIGLVSALASLGLQGLDVLDLPLSAIAAVAPWQAGFATSLGPSLLIAMAAMVMAWFARRSASMTIARVLTSVAMLGVGLSLAASGHAATASPQWLTRPSLVLHGVAVAYWIGALAPLAVMARRRTDTLPRVLNRFSAAAVPVVGMLVLSGLALAVIQLESFAALIETRYGIILSIKLALVVLLLMFAALNRFYLTPIVAADHANTDALRRSIVLEGVLVVAILAVVAGWRFTPPPRALNAAIAAPLAVHIHTDNAMFQVLVSPGAVGGNSFVLQLMNGDASPLAAKEATLILSLPERGIEPMERTATLGSDGYWHVSGVPLPYPGHWHMRIEALVTDFQKVTLEDELDIPQP
ncbi:MAG TPA: copper resistance protein CopC [Bradyrhizobium sp.]